MKQVGKIFLCIAMAALFGYFLLVDYPEMKQNLIPKASTSEPETEDQERERDNMVETVDEEDESESEEKETSLDDLETQIVNTKTVLLVGSIQESVYDVIYPTLEDADYLGTLLFTNGHLTGDYGQLSTTQFQSLVNAGWAFAVGGIDTDLDDEAWRSSLLAELDRIKRRSGVLPTVYFFEAGEYRSELETILAEEGFAAFYCAEEDLTAVAENASGLNWICYLPFAEETEIQDLLDHAWSYTNVAFVQEIDSRADDASAILWGELLTLLKENNRFDVVGPSDLLVAELEEDSDRAELVAAVVEMEKSGTDR